MRKHALTLMMTALLALAALFGAGCSDDEHPMPRVARIYASESCGVVPLRVDFRAEISGGEPFSEPTGGNNWLKMSWDFGDGNLVDNGTSVAYHQFEAPGVHTVTVTAEDARGKQATRSILVTVNADTMAITPFARVIGDTVFSPVNVPICHPVTLDYAVETCGFNPRFDSYDRFLARWRMNGELLEGPYPTLAFLPDAIAQDTVMVDLTIEDPGQSIFRHATLSIVPDDQLKADLFLSTDWWASDHPDYTGGETLELGEDERPDPDVMPVYFTYTVRLHNDSDVPAFDLTVVGHLHQAAGNNNHAMYVRSEPSSGTVSFFTQGPPGTRIKRWTWTIPVIEARSVETIDVTFRNEELPGAARLWPVEMFFNTAMEPYPCDVDPRQCEELDPDEDCKWTSRGVLHRLWN